MLTFAVIIHGHTTALFTPGYCQIVPVATFHPTSHQSGPVFRLGSSQSYTSVAMSWHGMIAASYPFPHPPDPLPPPLDLMTWGQRVQGGEGGNGEGGERGPGGVDRHPVPRRHLGDLGDLTPADLISPSGAVQHVCGPRCLLGVSRAADAGSWNDAEWSGQTILPGPTVTDRIMFGDVADA